MPNLKQGRRDAQACADMTREKERSSPKSNVDSVGRIGRGIPGSNEKGMGQKGNVLPGGTGCNTLAGGLQRGISVAAGCAVAAGTSKKEGDTVRTGDGGIAHGAKTAHQRNHPETKPPRGPQKTNKAHTDRADRARTAHNEPEQPRAYSNSHSSKLPRGAHGAR